MKKRRIWALMLAGLVLAALLMIPGLGLADAGGFAGDSNYGGGSDWGSSWSSGSDWGSDWGSNWGNIGWVGNDHYYFDSVGGGSDLSVFGVIVVIIIIVAVLGMRGRLGSSGSQGNRGYSSGPVNPGAQRTELPMTIADLMAKDPNFSQAEMKEKIGNLYVRMQECWQNKRWEEMRGAMTDALFNQMGSQLGALINRGQTNYVERIAVLGVDLTGYGQDEKNDMITAIVRTRIVDYTLSDQTGALVSGSKTIEKFMTYEWTLIRSKDAASVKRDENDTAHCPNCGAPLNLNHTAKCEYCGSIITAAEYDWVISAIKGISQRTS